jgi:TATA-box binding protein (TBP) (component of TFIID and TFIIIB)
MNLMLDDEWEMFLSNQMTTDNDVEEEDNSATNCFGYHKNSHLEKSVVVEEIKRDLSIEIPKASDIYISTKSKIAYLSHSMDLNTIFWGIKIIPYSTPEEGIIKKQMKFNSMTEEELLIIKENLKNEVYYEEQIITSIHNPTGRIKFKDIRKISVGISKKDIMSYRIKKKSAFYNCFVMIMRIKVDGIFKEFHIKIFNTGKVEIPGVQNDENYNMILLNIIKVLQPFIKTEILDYNQKSITVLINSNFNCGFYINRERLHEIFKYKYNIQSIYDPCSYPGIQSKFYYHTHLETQTGVKMLDDKEQIEVSFMVFRTGSILIVGMCDEKVLYDIYEFLKDLLIVEFHEINQKVIKDEVKVSKDKKKIRKKTLTIQINTEEK